MYVSTNEVSLAYKFRSSYCPIVLILGPGEHLHIGKGRFHAFRKLGAETLPDDDCHSDLRRKVHSTLGMDKNAFASLVNFSIAWDWSFLGWTPEGINREMAATLECALRHRKLANPKQLLAIPKLCLISCCKSSIAAIRSQGSGFGITVTSNDGAQQQHRNILKGLLPTLEFVVSQEQDAFQASGSVKLQNEVHPHSWENPVVFPIDPYGILDYSCKFCHQELANTYMHCNGCEDILKKDFNICAECHFDSKYRVFVIMNDQDFSFDSSLNHTGALSPLKHRNCKAKRCGVCQRGRKCCCTCHHNFSPQQRFWNCKTLLEVLTVAKDIVAEDKIPFHGEVSQRLKQALKGK